MFKILEKDNKSERRSGSLRTRHGAVRTPVFMPIATYGAVKNLTPEDLKSLGAEILLSNTYHLWLRPGTKIIKRAGGLHSFMNWDGPILTDSGGFQVFSLGAKNCSQPRANSSLSPTHTTPFAPLRGATPGFARNLPAAGVKISNNGVEFRDPLCGKKHFLTPEQSIQIQLDLGSDIIMVLDECPAYPASRSEVEQAVRRTTEWAKRCKKYFQERVFANRQQTVKQSRSVIAFCGIAALAPHRAGLARNDINRPLLFSIVQGGIYKHLRQKSARGLLEIGFDGYAIGGVAVGEPRRYLQKVLDWVLPLLPEDKPRYLMGLGKPEEIISAVEAGIDMFDCVIPTREARHGRLYKFSIFSDKVESPRQSRDNFSPCVGSPEGRQFSKNKNKKFYETMQITKSKFAKDTRPVDKNCDCYACRNFSRNYLNHLFKIKEGLGLRLTSIHNLKFYFDLVKKLRGF